ncbi:MAG: alpha-amylase family glycosyl hydrolase [Bacteroidales bacterium]|nr:alpha-amylase family glycosyl hydrolase [Bacteroidales bacterium]
MKRFLTAIVTFCGGVSLWAQAPENCEAVMLQGFYWDSYQEDGSYGRTKWVDLATQVDELSSSFDMIWLPPSAKSSGGVGYHPKQWSNQNSDWGDAAQLKALIGSFHNKNVKVIADIVINHRDGNYSWADFCNEDFGEYGKYTLYPSNSFICSDDECAAHGDNPTGAKDAGYDFVEGASGGYAASRDLDHSNETLQNAIKSYLQWMKGEMGYDGWRFDLVKGYLGKYIKMYTEAAGAYYSVGEYWDGNYDPLKNWVSDTGWSSTCFDFCAKYSLYNNALAKGDYQAMTNIYAVPNGICGADEMKRYATTFVDNHDTFRDGSKYTGDWAKANAVMLASPGIPCVFWPHWVSIKSEIQSMIAARKLCGIHSQSPCVTTGTCSSYYRSVTNGTKKKLICYVGSNWTAPEDATLACYGNGWAYYIQEYDGKYYIAGNGEQGSVWCNGNTWVPNGVQLSSEMTYEVTLDAGDYQFKITSGEWTECWGYYYLNKNASSTGCTNNQDDNICFSLTEKTNVTISFDAATHQITVLFAKDVPTGISVVEKDKNKGVKKYVRDGRVVVERDGEMYTILGQKIH